MEKAPEISAWEAMMVAAEARMTMGMSAQQITGISAAFSKAGADGGAAANVYTKILSDINRSIQYGSPELEAYSDILGVTVDQFQSVSRIVLVG